MLGIVIISHLGCRSQKLNKKKNRNTFSLLPFILLDLCLKLYGMIPSSLYCPRTFQSWTGSSVLWPEDPKVNSHNMLFCLGWGCSLEGQCYFAAAILCFITGFPNFFWGETYMYLLCYTSRLFSAQSFDKSNNMNQREDFILNAQQRKMGKVQCSWDILDIRRAA